jgi:hypothetical protein
MLKIEIAVIALMLGTAPAVADKTRTLARCQLEAERTYPKPDGRPIGGYLELNEKQVANLKTRAVMVETCMRAAGYRFWEQCTQWDRE